MIGKFTGFSTVVTSVAPVATQPVTLVTVTVYVPFAAVVAFAIVGFAKVDVKPFGPVQLYV